MCDKFQIVSADLQSALHQIEELDLDVKEKESLIRYLQQRASKLETEKAQLEEKNESRGYDIDAIKIDDVVL
eukprot:12834429-Ditylum_brightwellii.AAC.1